MPSLISGSIIAMALAASAGAPADRPTKLVAEPTDRGLLVRVVGQSPVDVRLRYRLQLGGGGEGGNRVSQAGAASLEGGGELQILATIRMSGPAPSGRLSVEFEDGGGYEEIVGADAR